MGFLNVIRNPLPSRNPNPPWLEPSSEGAELETALRQDARLFAIATRVAQGFTKSAENPRSEAEERMASGLPDGSLSSSFSAYPDWVRDWVNRPMAALAAYRSGEISLEQMSAIREAVFKYHGELLSLDINRAPALPSEIPDPPKGTYVSPNFGGDAEMARSTRIMLERHPKWKLVPKKK